MNRGIQCLAILKHSLRLERAVPQGVLSSFLFGLTVLILFSFAIGEVNDELKMQILLSQVFLCSFLVLQMVHQRILFSEQEDRAMDILVVSPLSYSAIYLAKVIFACLISGIIIFPFIGFMQVLHAVDLWRLPLLATVCLVLVALSSLGVLLTQMTEKASGRDLLYPLLYFPLSVPVLLAGVQASFCLWEIQARDDFTLWLGLLLVFCIIYLSLGVLLFEELLGLD